MLLLENYRISEWAGFHVWKFLNPQDEEIFIPENHGPFGNCIPV
jgi:hypothetical protein